MRKSILVVHPEAEMILTVMDILKQVASGEYEEPSIQFARHQVGAKCLAEKAQYDLVVSALNIPHDETDAQAAGSEGLLGLDLIRTLRSTNPEMPAVIICKGSPDTDVIRFAAEPQVVLLPEEGDIEPDLTQAVSKLLRMPSGDLQAERKRVDLEINLDPEDGGCTYRFHCEGYPSVPAKVLTVEHKALRSLVDKSKRVDVTKACWEEELREVGEELNRQLFEDTPRSRGFAEDFCRWEGVADGIQNMRIRFVVREELHPIALEAMRRNREYCGLRAPIYRGWVRPGVTPGIVRWALFQDDETRRGPINVLIIAADAEGYSDDLGKEYEHLPNLDQEVDSLERQLSQHRNEYRIADIRVIRNEELPDGVSFRQTVESTLKGGTWHVVHFAGHTDLKEIGENDVGYVILPGTKGKPVDAVKIDVFAYWLARSRFIFLSSCESAEKDFLFHLANEYVPAILGYRWPVADDMALEFAETFYSRLFSGEERSLEYAFLEAIKEMHRSHEDEPIWAAPVLVMQAPTKRERQAA